MKLSIRKPEITVAVIFLILTVIVFWQTTTISSPSYAQVGPTTVPYALTVIMAILGFRLLYEACTNGWQPDEERDAKVHYHALLWVIAGLVANVILISKLGFTFASIVMFICVARAFGSRSWARDGVIALIFALLAYFGFAKILGINIGGGLIENSLEYLLKGKKIMDAINGLMNGFAIALMPQNLLWCLLGTTLGTAIGVLPGLGPALTIALLLPITFKVDPTAAFILFSGIYYGAMYGGSTTSILLNTPGETASIVTSLEGNKMARKGRAGAALATAAIGSFVAGTIGTIGITFFGPAVVAFALKFGPHEYFALMVLAFITVSAVLGNSAIRGLVALSFGIWLGMIGIDNQTAQARFDFGIRELNDGINVIVVAVGLFAVGETLYNAARPNTENSEVLAVKDRIWMSKEDLSRSWKPWLRGTLFGFPIGAMPAGGAEIPTFLSYWTEKKLAKHPEEFGHGAIEGVAGPEAANNASTAGVLVPMLALGLPTSATAAIMLSAFQSYGINPGPLLFETQGALVWALIASLYIANIMLLILNMPLIPLWVMMLKIPAPQLYAGILVFATIGTYGISQSWVDLVLLYVIGFIGYLMRRFDFPTSPVIIGMILGPYAEQEFRRAMQISVGDPFSFFQKPLCAFILFLALFLVVVPKMWQYYQNKRAH